MNIERREIRSKETKIQVPIALYLQGHEDVMLTKFGYNRDDPYAFTILFPRANKEDVTWVCGRRDLLEAIDTGSSSGEGDVKFGRIKDKEQKRERLSIELSSPSGRVSFETPLPPIEAFLSKTEEIVPLGDEFVVFSDLFEKERLKYFTKE